MALDELELKRLKKMLAFERKAKQQGYQNICGIDEAGRGPLAGPVVAAACILPPSLHKDPSFLSSLNDSKKLTPGGRDSLFQRLIAREDIHYGIGIATEGEIDEINIFQATILAMKRSLVQLTIQPCLLLVDGMNLDFKEIPSWKIVKGDALALSIAAASILAKVTRDKMMADYHSKWPLYGFYQHKGYPTKAHKAAIKEHGPCPLHRKSFCLN